ncbi:hypothetical protein RND81_01G035800 [Saponaria officinalis]|uniref:AMP-activated protein kinase glycogen-binding domain-containing protein n=1 Tax=Saponaria officinalis TaxID=3572 RepID=A0AAW1NCP5_SAPOF
MSSHLLSFSLHHNYQPCNPSSFSFHSTSNPNFTHFNPKLSFLCLASANKSRPSRKIMSDEELCNGLKEFIASFGLPEGHVPSTKELTKHGRIDLANIVRRRGHKLIKELLANDTKPTVDEYVSWENPNGAFSGSSVHEETGQEEKATDPIEESIDLTIDDSAVDASLVMTSESVVCSDNEKTLSVEPSVSLQEKVENFMKYGQLDAVEGDEDNLDGRESVIHGGDKLSHVAGESSSSTESNGTLTIQRLMSPHATEESHQSNDFDPEISSETIQASSMDDEDEVNRLKLMLHQKEMELCRLKEEIEKEKKELSILQTKAEDEINKAQKLITEKEAELLAAEESLSGLVEAKIHYSGEGHTVEIAGSFNGWHQRIKMDPQISSVIVDPSDSRKSKLWAATLWLYPGVYEMKFIVDGQWKIDPQREITIRHGVENNILRVDP